MSPSKMAKADFLTGAALSLLGVYVIVESWRMPRFEYLKVHPLSVPGLVPGLLGFIIVIFGAILIVRSVQAGGHRLGLNLEAVQRVLTKSGNQRLLVTAALTIGYAGYFVGRVPYWLATGLFIFLFMVVFEWRRGMTGAEYGRLGAVAAILSVATTLVVVWVFERLFLVTLP
jgi:hypothetical protein